MLPCGKELTLVQIGAFADNSFIIAKMVDFFFDGEENIVVKGENAGFSSCHNVFERLLPQGC